MYADERCMTQNKVLSCHKSIFTALAFLEKASQKAMVLDKKVSLLKYM